MITSTDNLKIGQMVRVSDGRPRPPKHHSRKLRVWENRNYTGPIEALYPASESDHQDHDEIDVLIYDKGWMRMVNRVRLGGSMISVELVDAEVAA